MPRLWTFSDCHQEWPENRWDPAQHAPVGGFDAVAVAGDVASPLTAALDWLHDRFAGVQVIYVPGNHDLWCDPDGDDKYTLDDMIARGRDRAARHGIDLLVDDTVMVYDARIVGATLWTDLRLCPYPVKQAARLAERGMRDYKRIRQRLSGHHKYVRAIDLLALHRNSLAYLNEVLSAPHAGPTVVLTHHAPSVRWLDEHEVDLSWCYASALDDRVELWRPAAWVHGHIHRRAEYTIDDTRVVCNALGHVEERGARTAFDPSLVLTA